MLFELAFWIHAYLADLSIITWERCLLTPFYKLGLIMQK